MACDDAVFKIEMAKSDSELLAAFPVIRQLQPHLVEEEFIPLVRQLEQEVGYQVAFVSEECAVTCVAGFRLCRSLGWGKYLYVDDLVTDEIHRSSGAGHAMLKWLAEFAAQAGCAELRLDSAVWRHDAHRFYLRERMDIVGFHFRLTIEI